MYSNVTDVCRDAAFARFLNVFQNILKLIQIIGPILCIISLIILFINMMANPDDKKVMKKIINSVIALVIVFCVPLLVNVVVSLVDDGSNFKLCWENKVDNSNDDSSYIDDDKEPKKNPVDPGLYEDGKTDEE